VPWTAADAAEAIGRDGWEGDMQQRLGIELAAESLQRDTLWAGEQHIVVALGDGLFAVPLTAVQEVERVPEIVPVPGAPAWGRGVVNLRGTILTVVDLAHVLGVGVWRPSAESRMLVTRDDEPVAVIVDDLRGMRRLPDTALSPIEGRLASRAARYVLGVYRGEHDLVSVLNLQQLLDDANDSPDSAGTADVLGSHDFGSGIAERGV
jgi:purine-binding chemotaxis protein CheW